MKGEQGQTGSPDGPHKIDETCVSLLWNIEVETVRAREALTQDNEALFLAAIGSMRRTAIWIEKHLKQSQKEHTRNNEGLSALPAALVAVVRAVARNPLATSSKVFGSMARFERAPKDLDLLVILPGLRSPNDGGAPHFNALYQLLSISSRWPGWLDPFVWNGKRLWCRDDGSNYYISSRLGPHIEQILAAAVPLEEVLAHYALPRD